MSSTETKSAPLVCIEHVDFAYDRQLVLKQINLDINSGEMLGLIGPNGGGKTTLVKLLLGLLKPTRGKITIAGKSPQAAIACGNIIGYLPQKYSIPNRLPVTVSQLVQLGLAGKTGILKPYAPCDLAYAENLIRQVGMGELADTPVQQLSVGQLQQVCIARALVNNPRLLLLDEPTTGIDLAGQKRFIEFFQSLREKLDLTVVLVSHDLSTLRQICGREAHLNVTLTSAN